MGHNISSCPLASHCHHWHCRYPKALGPYQGSVTQSSPNPVLLCIAHKLNRKKEGGKLRGKASMGGGRMTLCHSVALRERSPGVPSHITTLLKIPIHHPNLQPQSV